MVGVCLLLATVLPFSELDYRVVADYDFNELTNTSGKVIACEDMLVDDLECFTGSYLRIPAYTNGIVQISVNTNKGHLVYNVGDKAAWNEIFIYARKTGSSPKTCLLFADLMDDNQIVEDCRVTITTNSACYRFAFDEPVENRRIMFHQRYDIKSTYLIWIDRIIFAREREHGFYFIIR